MTTALADTMDFDQPVITVSRGQMGIVMVSGETEGLRDQLLDRNFRFSRWILNGEAAWFLPRSVAKRHSDEVMKETKELVQASGALLQLGRDDLHDGQTFSCSAGHDVPIAKKPSAVPDFAQYDSIIIQSSGGKDSLAMLSFVARLTKAAGVSHKVTVLHQNLGKVEWPGTADLVVEQAKHFGLKCIVLPTREQGDVLSDVEFMQGDFPNHFNRFCTSEQKFAQAAKFITKLVEAFGFKRRTEILNCVGLRAEESGRRQKANDFVEDGKLSNKTKRRVDRWLPIQGWSVEDVWAEIDESGAPHHYAYDLGNERVSCVHCVFGSEADLLNGASRNPELAADYIGVEQRLGRPLSHRLPMVSIGRRLGITQEDVSARPVPERPAHLADHVPRAQRPETAAKIAAKEAGLPPIDFSLG